MAAPVLRRRPPGNPSALPDSLHPVLRRIYASRGLAGADELALDLERLLPPDGLLGIDGACHELADAIAHGRRIVIAGDYDADGATGAAVAVLGLRALGAAHADYVVPDRFRMGYGLSPALVEVARARGAEVLVTVDNGIASVDGVAAAIAHGLRVVVTDHHLPGATLPAAHAIVNPNQRGCPFPGKQLAGVGVMFYVLVALRARLRAAGAFASQPTPNLAALLDLVALGTVADVVPLDYNNRILVAQGLARLRAGRGRPGLHALLQVAGRDARQLTSLDLGFVLGPRLNAAGRLDDMRTGIECLLAPSVDAALPLATALDRMNRERREIETQMRDEAFAQIVEAQETGVCLFDATWHEGVVGLVASRVKDRLHRPAIALARAQEPGLLKGSGRSIPGLHLRDVLADVDAGAPGLILRFGGHAMAAGLTLAEKDWPAFARAFDVACRRRLGDVPPQRVIDTDGPLAAGELTIDTARALVHAGPWGQGFPEPRFDDDFEIVDARCVGQEHARYQLRGTGGARTVAIHFGGAATLQQNGRSRVVYRLSVNRYQGLESVELAVEHMLPAALTDAIRN